MHRRSFRGVRLALLAVVTTASLGLGSRVAVACPICNGVALTLADEIAKADVMALATLVSAPPADKDEGGLGDIPEATFAFDTVLKGALELEGQKEFKALYFGNHPAETRFLVYGSFKPVFRESPAQDETDKPQAKDEAAEEEEEEEVVVLQWTTPTPITARACEYLQALVKLPAKGPDRLAYFQDCFEDADRLVAIDSYEEFAKAPYDEIVQLKPRMQHDKLVAWVGNPAIPTTHRRLYLMLLGVCGTPDDVPLLESLIENPDRSFRTTLDGAVSCYLNLAGAEGMPLIEKLFLGNPKAEYNDIYGVVMALRFQQDYSNAVPKDRLLQAFRLLLDRRDMADLIIPDLARSQDWSVVDKLVTIFKEADKITWVRVPIFNYLRQCPLPEAKKYMEELAVIDPKAFKQAKNMYPLRSAKPDAAAPNAEGDKPTDAKSKDAKPTDPNADAAAGKRGRPAASK